MAVLATVLVRDLSPGTLVFGAQGSSAGLIQVVNLDSANTVTLGNNSNVQVGGAQTFALGPGASMSFDSSVALYGITPTGISVNVGVVPGGGNYSPGAGQDSNVYTNAAPVVAPGGMSTSLGTFNVSTYTSIVASFGAVTTSSNANGTAVCAVYQLNWYDQNMVNIANDTVSMIIGTAVTYEIPVRGYYVRVLFVNVGVGSAMTAPASSLVIDGSYRNVSNIRAVTTQLINNPVITGCLVFIQPPPVYAVAAWVASILYSWPATAETVVIPLPLWVGEVTGWYAIITTALARNATIVDLTVAVNGSVVGGTAYQYGIVDNIPSSIDANPVSISVNLPPTQCAVVITTPAVSGEFEMSLIGVGN
jgi:hypothetical protein